MFTKLKTMKKNLFFIASFFFAINLLAQKELTRVPYVKQKPVRLNAQIAETYYYQDFEDSLQAATSMIFIDNDKLKPHYEGMETWIIASDGFALSSSYYDNGDKTADDWLITPQITVGNSAFISWDAMAFDAQYADGYKVYISTTGQAVPTDFKEVYSVSAEKTDWTHHLVDITDLAAGKNIYVAFRNNSTDKYYLAVDNIRVYAPNTLDGEINSLSLRDYELAATPCSMKITFSNAGLENLALLNINWQLNDGEIHTDSIKNLNLAIGESYTYQHSDSLIFTEGENTVKVWLDNVNATLDENTSNDTLIFHLMALKEKGDRKILIEHFTQASCGPCAAQNPSFYNLIFDNQNKGNIAHIAYHPWWPGVDPMYNFNEEDVKNRVSYYGVTGVPHVVLAGNKMEGAPGQIGQLDLDHELNSLGIFKINLDSYMDGNILKIYSQVIALTDINNIKKLSYRIVLVEDKDYSSPPGSNGEKSFPNVMRKMFPDADGTSWENIKKGDTLTLNFDYNVPSEINITACSLVAFVQNDSTKEVYAVNTRESDKIASVKDYNWGEIAFYPIPAGSTLHISTQQKFNSIEIYNISGKIVKRDVSPLLVNQKHISVANLKKGIYLLKMSDGKHIYSTKFVKE